MFRKGDYVEVNGKIHTHDQYDPPRHDLEGKCGRIAREHEKYPLVQFYRDHAKDPPIPMKVPEVCLTKITYNEFMSCVLQCPVYYNVLCTTGTELASICYLHLVKHYVPLQLPYTLQILRHHIW